MPGRLARQNALRNPTRTASTATALTIGVSVVVFLTILASSVKASFAGVIDRQFTGDLVVDSGTFGFGGLSTDVADRVAGLDGVAASTGVRAGFAREPDGEEVFVSSVDAAEAFDVFDIGVLAGDPADLGLGTVGIHTNVADEFDVGVGDTVTLTWVETGQRALEVAIVYDELELAGRYTLDHAEFERNVADQFDFSVFIGLDAGADADVVADELETLLAPYPQADVQNLAEYKETQTSFIDQILAMMVLLTLFAAAIALAGIGNTMALSIHERTRELGVLRAVGMTRRQLRTAVRWESALIALFGAVLGLAMGLFFGGVLAVGVTEDDFVLDVPVGQIVAVAVIAAAAAVLASLRPAFRASRLDVLGAIATE